MKLWGKLIKKQRVIRQELWEWPTTLWSADALHFAMGPFCEAVDLARPVVLEKHAADMERYHRVTFIPRDFLEPVAFDRMEIEAIFEKDEPGYKESKQGL